MVNKYLNLNLNLNLSNYTMGKKHWWTKCVKLYDTTEQRKKEGENWKWKIVIGTAAEVAGYKEQKRERKGNGW